MFDFVVKFGVVKNLEKAETLDQNLLLNTSVLKMQERVFQFICF